MKKTIRKLLPFIGLVIFIFALVILNRELRHYHYRDIIESLRALAGMQIFFAFLLTCCSYLILTGYDALALFFIQKPLPYWKALIASFVSHAFSQNVGFSIISGGSVRYRLYSLWGLSSLDIAKVIAFTGLSYWVGFMTVGGISFVLEPMAVPAALHLPLQSLHVLGFFMLALVVAYLVLCLFRREPFRIRLWEFYLPRLPVAATQVLLSSLDWMISGSVLYILLSDRSGISFSSFLGIYLVAQIAGVSSQIPGGLGVFETVMLILLAPSAPRSSILAALLAFRAIYYLVPLLVAALTLAAHELSVRFETVTVAAQKVGRFFPSLVPQIFAVLTFIAGAILLFSGATPSIHSRLAWIKDFLPLPVMEISHFLGSIVGVALLLLARGLQRRLDIAYFLTAALLGFGILFSLLKGFDYEEAIILTAMLAALLPCHRYFFRKASLIHERFSAGWITSIILVIVSTIWLGYFSHKHVEYSGDLWWRFSFTAEAPRFLRASVGVIMFVFFVALFRLMQSGIRRPREWPAGDLEQAIPIIQKSRNTYANLALLRDKYFMFSESGNSFIMYGIEGRSFISMGNPVGPEEEIPDLLWNYREFCDRHDAWPVFYQVDAQSLPLYIDFGFTFLKLGEEGRVPVGSFSLQGDMKKHMRNTKNRLEKEGYEFEIIPREQVPPLLPKLKVVSDAWLSLKKAREKGFSLGRFSEDYLRYFPIAIVRSGTQIVAFANLWFGVEKEEYSVDLMRFIPQVSDKVMDFLFIKLLFWGQEEGYKWFNLGMTPFSGMENRPLAPLWQRLAAIIFRYGENFYNFQGLRQYKEKFDPVWEPKYLACPGGLILPVILMNITSLISRGLKGAITK